MADERITTVESPDGSVTHTTVVQERPAARGGGAGWFIGLVLLLALAVGGYLLATGSDSETAKDNAIADAASNVGTAARRVGDAAQDAADNLNQ